jgi:hypothetical protein
MSDFFGVEYDILDQIDEPGRKLRLVQGIKSKKLAIQYYGTMGKRWVTTQSHGDIMASWNKTKNIWKALKK